MPAPFERRAITFDGKPVILYVSAPPSVGRPFLARCHGVTLATEAEGFSEEQYIARIQSTATEMGLSAQVQRRDDRELVFDVKVKSKR